MKKRVIAVVLSLLLILSLAACAQKTQPSPDHATDAVPSNTTADNTADSATPQSEEPVEITFWHSYSEGEERIFTDTVLTAFEKAYPNIKVNAIRMPYEGLDEQLITAVTV